MQDTAPAHDALDVTGVSVASAPHIATAAPVVHEAAAVHVAAAAHVPIAAHLAPAEHGGVSGPVGIPVVDGLHVPQQEVVDPTAADPSSDGHGDGLWSQATDSIEGALNDVGDALDTIFD